MTASKVSPWVKSTCAYCGVGCGIETKLTAQGEVKVRGDESHPANWGRLCSKGLALGETVSHEGRLLHPMIDGEKKEWPQALEHVATRFSQTIAEYGPDSVAFYVSGQLLTEDYYVANKLMKGFIGSGNIDTNSRLCMSSSVAGHKRAFGSDTVPGCYEDLELSDMIVITGSNLAWCHPVLYQRIKAEKVLRPTLKVVVIDPRETNTCEIADIHLAITPDRDVTLFNGLLSYLVYSNQIDHAYIQEHTEGLEEALSAAIRDSGSVPELAKELGVDVHLLDAFYRDFSATEKVVTIYSQGVNQSTQGTDKVNSILNCHLVTGRIGKPGSSPFSVTGQPNAMGGREVGGLANTLAAHMEFGNERHHQLVSKYWQTPNLAAEPGLKAVDLFDAIENGKVKAVWIMATNPVVSLPDSDKIKRALEKCPLVVVSDCIEDTDTNRCANVLLPAQGWSEKSGTVTNSERRISRQRRLLPTPGEGKPDWWIISEVAKKMGFGHGFNYLHEAEIFSEYATMTGLENEVSNNGVDEGRLSRDLNITGLAELSLDEYVNMKPQQWPVLTLQSEEVVHQRLFSDGQFFTPSGKAQFIAVSQNKTQPKDSESLPFSLNSGRIRDQWHTMTRSGLSARLGSHLPEPFVSIHPDDAKDNGLSMGDIATISSPYGEIQARVDISHRVRLGELFMPIHWSLVTASNGKVCRLVNSETDPISGQPAFKLTQVAIKPWRYTSEAMLFNTQPLDLSQVDYWVKQKVKGGYLYRVASLLSPLQLHQLLEEYCQFDGGRELTFHNEAKGEYRSFYIGKRRGRCGYVAAKNLQQHELEWLQELLASPVDPAIELSVFSGKAEGRLATGKTVCACKQVGLNTIRKAIREQNLATVEELGRCTSAGTGCGSCVSDLESILEESRIPVLLVG